MTMLYRISDEQLPAALSFLAAAGGTARTAETWRQDRMTALVLGERGGIEALMPMSRREIAVAPGRTASVGWLSSNQFAAKMSMRRRTRETAPQWADLLPELDALVAVRRDEGSLAARWYAHTGFQDVLSIRCLYLDMDGAPLAQAGATRYTVRVASAMEAAPWQTQMLAVYRDVYGTCGGAVVRHDQFWQPALAHHFYHAHYQFQIVGLWSGSGGGGGGDGATLMGYAVVGWSGWHSKRPRMDILELATRQWDTAVATELLRTTCQLAWSKGVHQVRAVISAHDPYRGHLARSGFVDRWGYVLLAKWLHPQRYLDRLAKTLPTEAQELSVQLAVPGAMPLTLTGEKSAGGGGLRLQCDARVLTRLLLQRLEVGAALHGGAEGALFSSEGIVSTGDESRLGLAFPWTPWVFHMLDFI
jgi:hypothetical protein